VVVERVPVRGEGKAGKLHLMPLLTSDSGPRDRDATTAERDFALRRPGPPGLAIRVALPARTAQVLAVLLHHRSQDLLARVDAQLEERLLDVREGSQQRERDLHNRRLRGIDELEVIGLLGMLGHGGGSFVV
jgi:hypothetical protein